MTYDQILQELKSKNFSPVYLLMGEEAYFIDIVSDYIQNNLLTEAEKAFNQSVFYGKDTDANTIINAARRFPMMSEYQVIIVKEAQNLKDIENLVVYLDKPLGSTILVLNYKYGSLDKRKKLFDAIKKKGVVLESDKLYEDKVPSWVSAYVKGKGFSIDAAACSMLVEYLGADLGKIANELDKLSIILPSGTSMVNASHIEKYIGISKDYNNFELQKAIIQKDVLKANQIVNYFSDNQKDNPFVMTITILFSFFSKLLIYHSLQDKSQGNAASVLKIRPFFVRDYEMAAKRYSISKCAHIISLLREYDMKSKGVDSAGSSMGDLLKELIYKILH